jgi:hypothetical protein
VDGLPGLCGRRFNTRLCLRLISHATLCVLAWTGHARAQVAEAAVGGEQQFAVGGLVSAMHIDYGKRWLGGSGIYVDANLNVHLGLEGEARRLNEHEEAGTHAATYLGGARYTFNSPHGRLRPYAKALAGVGEFYFPYGYAKGSYLVVSGGGGFDLRLSRHIRVRLIDVEYQRWPFFTYGSMSAYGASAGVRYAFR